MIWCIVHILAAQQEQTGAAEGWVTTRAIMTFRAYETALALPLTLIVQGLTEEALL